jgi:protein-S-isoprenylcysteine O-methyltransferase Ste14
MWNKVRTTLKNMLHHKHGGGAEQRDALTGEHPLGDAGQFIVACLFGAMWVADTFLFKYTTFLNRYPPLGLRVIAAVALVCLSGYLAKTGLAIVFGEERDKPAVIEKGVFGVVRHPIYLSEILFYLGLLMLSLSLAAAGVWIVAIGFFHYISRYEERLLLARFGDEYKRYMRDVPMWIPRFRKSEKSG